MIIERKTYSEDFKRAMVEKIARPGGPSATALSKDVGVAQCTLSKWVKQYASVTAVKKSRDRRPKDWTAEDKLRAIKETANMSEAELGAYLRREGVHASNLEQWEKEIVEGLQSLSVGRGRPRSRSSEDKKKIKELERDLRRKEKALAETTALIVLKKKAELIWGLVEDDEPT
jgi:transposase